MRPDLTAGDSLNFTVVQSTYPASAGWVLKYRLVPRAVGGAAISIVGTASGDDHLIQVAAATTAGWAAGIYGWSSWVEKLGEVYTLESGQLTIAPDPRTVAAGTDTRTAAQAALDAITATLQGKATTADWLYRINDREVRSYTIQELLALETKLRADVAAERRAAGLVDRTNSARRVAVRMA